MNTQTQKLDISALSAQDKAALMEEWAKDVKKEKQKKKDDRKAFKELTAEFVNENIDKLINHNDITGILIEQLFKEYKVVEAIKNELYGRSHQDNHTSTLPDGSASITIGHNVSIKFDGTESSGVEKIKNFIISLSDEDSSSKVKQLAKMVDTFLKLNPKTGMLNPSKIIELSKLRDDFNNEEFDDGLDIIFNAQIRTQNSMYVSGWKYVQLDTDKPKQKLTFRFSV